VTLDFVLSYISYDKIRDLSFLGTTLLLFRKSYPKSGNCPEVWTTNATVWFW